MKLAIKTATYFANAIIELLDDNGYGESGSGTAFGESGYIFVNTEKKSYKDATDASNRQVFDPTTQWADIAALVTSNSGGAQASAAADSNGICVGDVVTAINKATTAAKFRLQEGHNYTVDRITAKGNIGLAGLPNDEYAKSRFTVNVSAMLATPAAAPSTPVATVEAVDIAGNVLRVGDTVLVQQPDGKKPVFRLRPNGVAVITRIGQNGTSVGFAFDEENTFSAKRFQKVTLATVTTGSVAEDNYISLNTGDLVVARPGRHARNAENAAKFALPENTALEFLGATSTCKVIIKGYNEHQYAVQRFSLVTPVTPN
jgi:hypothetical protein